MLVHNPDSLANLAVYSFGNYVKDLCLHWMSLARRDTKKTQTGDNGTQGTELVDFRRLQADCARLQKMLASVMMSSETANDVTMKLFRCVDFLPIISFWARDYNEELVMFNIADAIIHPAVTQLNFTDISYYPWYSIDLFACVNLARLEKLKILQLRSVPRCKLVTLPTQSLQELTIRAANNDVLRRLSVSCRGLRKIDIEGSKSVSGAAVPFLVQFKQLEQLNVKGTQIDGKVMAELLTGLAGNKDSRGIPVLKSFGCGRLTERQFQMLCDTFLNLVALKFRGMRLVDISKLANLKHLHTLMIGEVWFILVKYILKVIGHQLKHLQFTALEVDLGFIATTCPSLLSLKLTAEVDCDMRSSSEMAVLSNFKSLKLVELTLKNCPNMLTCLLSCCTNVKVMKVMAKGITRLNIADVLEKNPFTHLEELHWWSRPMHPEITRELVYRCQNLSFVHGNFWWSRNRSVKLWYDDGPYTDLRIFFQFLWSGQSHIVVKPLLL